MSILHYNNKIHLIWDILFKPQLVKKTIELEKQEFIDNIKKEYEEKLRYISYDQYKNGIVQNTVNKHQIAIAKMPLIGVEDKNMVYPTIIKTSIEYKKIEQPYFLSYLSEHTTIEELKNQHALALAKILVDNGYLQTIVNANSNVIKFYINTF